jgi:hypothetical protein
VRTLSSLFGLGGWKCTPLGACSDAPQFSQKWAPSWTGLSQCAQNIPFSSEQEIGQ